MRIFIVNIDFPPIGGPGVWRMLSLVTHLANSGHDVTVFCSDRSSWHSVTDGSLLSRLPAAVRVVRTRSLFLRDILAFLQRIEGRTRVGWIQRATAGLRWRLERIWPHPTLFWALKTACRATLAALRERPDCIVTSGPQHLSHLTGHLIRKLGRGKWIMDYRDPWTFPMVSTSMDELGSYQHRLQEFLERRFLAAADAVVVVSPSWLHQLAAHFGRYCSPDKFHLIRNGHEIDLSDPGSSEDSDRAHGRDFKGFWVHFNGRIQPNNNVQEALSAALLNLWRRGTLKRPVRFTFCGLPEVTDGPVREAVEQGLVVDLGPLDQASSLRQCRLADALMVVVKDEFAYRGAIPAKTYEAMATGKYVLGLLPREGDVVEILEGYPGSVLGLSSDVAELERVIEKLYDTWLGLGEQLPALAVDQRNAFIDKHHRKHRNREFAALIATVSGGAGLRHDNGLQGE